MNWVALFAGLFIFLTIGFWTTNVHMNEKFMKYFSILSVFSTIAFIMSFLISLEKNRIDDERRLKHEDEKKTMEFIDETEKNWINLEKFFISNYPYLSRLYREIYPQSNITIPQLTPEQQIEAENKEYHMTEILIQTIENITSTQSLDKKSSWGWEAIFKSWSQSSIFQKNWAHSKQFYNPTTRTIIDGLISKYTLDKK